LIWAIVIGVIFLVPNPSILRTHPNTGERINRLLQLLEVRQPSQMLSLMDQLILPHHFSQVSRGPRRRIFGLWY
jgi:heat shock protein HtpX